jgi:hypothetical protein
MMKMMIIVPNVILISDILEEAILKIGLVNWNLPCQTLNEDLILKFISLGN